MVAALVSAVVGALVGAALSPVTNNVMAQVFKLVEKDTELWDGFNKDMKSLRKDLRMLIASGNDQLSGWRDPSAVRRIIMDDMQKLSYDIQDCMDRILCYSECGHGHGRDLAKEVKSLKEQLKDALKKQQQSNYIHPSIPKEKRGKTEVRQPVGIEKPKEELCKVLEGHPEELSVISIVGFSGLGKTTLARAVYDCYEGTDHFQCRAWVAASEHEDDVTLLMALQKQLFQKDLQSYHVQSIITSFLKNKRYLIVLDDIDEPQWHRIKSTFPVDKRSRIIVTTTTMGIGKLCCKHGKNGYVYNMRPLEQRHSKELLDGILKNSLPGFDQNSALVLEKLDGHPLSLLSVANYLLKKDEFPENFWNDLGDRMMKEYAFSELQQVLIKYFSNLQGNCANLKILLLYICVFPNKYHIRRSRLIRRWLAEGYVEVPTTTTQQVIADQNLEELIDLNIIRPVDPSKNAKPKTCRAHGIMHEFLLHIARSVDFITDLGNPLRNNYRHLFVEGRPSTSRTSNFSVSSSDEKKEPRAHSLTVCGSAGEAVLYLPNCEFLRVLDLEECNELEDRHTVDIHQLWHLKYLSLGAKITKVPEHFENLYCLETLDLRKTQIEVLPVGVIKLPHLAHLLGKFKLEERNWDNNIKADKFLPPRSNLRTLTGFLTDDNPGFPKLMVHMKELNKVKIWCNSNEDNASTPPSQNSVGSNASTPDCPPNENSVAANASTSDSPPSECFTFLLTAIMFFIQSRLDTPGVDHCLSLYLGNSSEEILTSLSKSLQLSRDRSPESSRDAIPCAYLSSLKLHGKLYGLTQIISLVGGLKELCLLSSNGLTLDEVSNLAKLEALEYLKLVNISLGVITSDDFKNLRRLCLVECGGLPIIQSGALSNLLSLRILNKDLKGLSNMEIENLTRLQEVGLHSDVMRETKMDWEDAAKKHPRRPRLLFFKMVDSSERAPDAGTLSVMPVEQEIRTDGQSMEGVEDMLTAQENRNDISSDSQNPNARAADEHRNMNFTDVQLIVEVEDVLTDQENRDGISSESQNPNARATDEHGKMNCTDVQLIVEVEDVLADQENRNDISSDSQNPNEMAADGHGKMNRTDGESMLDVEGVLTGQENRDDISSDSQNPNARVVAKEHGKMNRTYVQLMVEVKDTAKENRDDISSDSQNLNARAAADEHENIKEYNNYYIADKDRVEGKNDKNHNGLAVKQPKKKSEGWKSKILRKMGLRKSPVTDNSIAKGKGIK